MKRPIVFIHHSPHFGGAEKHLIELARSLGRQQNCVIWCDPVDFYSKAFHGWPNTHIALKPYRINKQSIFRFWIELARLRPRVVVLSKGIADIYPWTVYLAARFCGARRVIVIEQLIANPAPAPDKQTGLRGWVRRLFGWRTRYMLGKRLEGYLADVTVAVSEAVRERLVTEYHYPAGRTVTIYNGVDLALFKNENRVDSQPMSVKQTHIPEAFRMICVARLSPVKRIDILLESLALLDQMGKKWACTIVGGGPLEKELIRKAESLGLESRVRFTGHVEQVRSFMEAADLAILSSEKEGLPLSLVEAMACGLPCVVTDAGGNREIVKHGETGLVVEVGSSKQLAEGIAYCMDHAEERVKMGQAAQRLAYERFDLNRMAEAYKALLLMEFDSPKSTDRVSPVRQST